MLKEAQHYNPPFFFSMSNNIKHRNDKNDDTVSSLVTMNLTSGIRRNSPQLTSTIYDRLIVTLTCIFIIIMVRVQPRFHSHDRITIHLNLWNKTSFIFDTFTDDEFFQPFHRSIVSRLVNSSVSFLIGTSVNFIRYRHFGRFF